MFFDVMPKERVEDLYDMEDELRLLVKFLRDPYVRMIVVLGPRRTGKTSLLKVALNLVEYPYLYMDARKIFGSMDYFGRELEKGFEKLFLSKKYRRLLSMLSRRVKGISIAGVRMEFRVSDIKMTLTDILECINDELREDFFILALDEAQELSSLRWLPKMLAYCYDNLRRIKVVVTGSEVRVLEDFIGEGNPKSPLYGRPYTMIRTKRLSKDRSLDFLRKGFQQIRLNIGEDILMEAVENLDGVIGWLTYFGWYAWKHGDPKRGLEEAVLKGSIVLKSELDRFLIKREEARARYIAILKATSIKPLSWSQINRYLMAELGRKIAPNQLTKYLNNLIRYGFLEKIDNKYYVSDPLLKNMLETQKFY